MGHVKLIISVLVLACMIAPSLACFHLIPRPSPGPGLRPTVNPCSSNPCVKGVCSSLDGSYTCQCPSGYTGVHCENADCQNNMFFDECASPCGPARCGVEPGLCATVCDPKCNCPGFTKLCPEGMLPQNTCVSNCTTDCKDDLCSSNPCVKGTCFVLDDGYVCHCEPGYRGENCEIADCQNNMFFDECASPCGPARCGVEPDLCATVCDPKCNCPGFTKLCPEGMQPTAANITCVEDCSSQCSSDP